MKHVIFIAISLFLLATQVISLNNRNNAKRVNNKQQNEENVSVAYGLGSTGGYTLQDQSNYSTPQIISSIAGNQRWARNVSNKETVDEIPSAADYYDGSNNLNNVRVDCIIYTDKNDCLRSSHCGWCGSRNCCVEGNAMGPIQSCDKTSYIFDKRNNNILTGSLESAIQKPLNIQMIKDN